MHKSAKWVKGSLKLLAIIILLVSVLLCYLVWVSKITPPVVKSTPMLHLTPQQQDSGLYTIQQNWFRKSNSGLYEMYVQGTPYERGIVNGKLSRDLVQRQENYFNEQIEKMIPSKFYLHFLKYFVGWFNRNLEKYVTDEYKQEIYGISQSASDHYEYIGTKYARILNYHAAHDIGHALQNMMLVGCTSFATWGAASQDSALIIGRNFDFWVGDNFSKNKIVSFVNPSRGYKYMSVTWGGFIGVVSGMNEKGLTITINAAKSSIPSGSATPVSLVAREIVQYAKNIEEAIAIAGKRKMFVSESFLVGSAWDNKAVIIEKTPDSLSVYDPHQNEILCTNHFQSNTFWNTQSNIAQRTNSASVYRYKRLAQLLQQNGKNTVEKTIHILRDHKGIDNADIGLGNEKAVNQFIAHHAIVFEPKKLRVWISSPPWQMGQFVCYDLNKIFAIHGMNKNAEVCEPALSVAADSFLYTPQFKKFEAYRKNKELVANGISIVPDSIVAYNPTYYNSYVVAGDYCFKQQAFKKALAYYEKSLLMEIATEEEHAYVVRQVAKCKQKL